MRRRNRNNNNENENEEDNVNDDQDMNDDEIFSYYDMMDHRLGAQGGNAPNEEDLVSLRQMLQQEQQMFVNIFNILSTYYIITIHVLSLHSTHILDVMSCSH